MAKFRQTSLSQLSKRMSRVFSLMIPVSADIWRNLFMTFGIVAHSSWVINNSNYIRDWKTKMEAAGSSSGKGGQQTYEFSKMYTSIKLKCVEEKMNQ